MHNEICSRCVNELICTENPSRCSIYKYMSKAELFKCKICGQEFPESEMNHSGGHVNNVCKKCAADKRAKTTAEKRAKKEHEAPLDKVEKLENLTRSYTNPELAKFTPRQLIDELKARGYHGKLYTTVEVHI